MPNADIVWSGGCSIGSFGPTRAQQAAAYHIYGMPMPEYVSLMANGTIQTCNTCVQLEMSNGAVVLYNLNTGTAQSVMNTANTNYGIVNGQVVNMNLTYEVTVQQSSGFHPNPGNDPRWVFTESVPTYITQVHYTSVQGGGGNWPGGGWYGPTIDIWGKGSVPYNGYAIGRTNFIGPGRNANPYTIPDPRNPGQFLQPIDAIDKAAQRHDAYYWKAKTGGILGALFNTGVVEADLLLTLDAYNIMQGYKAGGIDEVTGMTISERTYNLARAVYYFFAPIVLRKVNPY